MTHKHALLLAALFLSLNQLPAQWQPVQMPASVFNSRAFVQDSVLLVCLNQFFPQPKATFRSADFGATWTALPDSLANYYYTFKEADGFIYAYDGPYTIVSADGGVTWNRLDVPYGPFYGNHRAFLRDTVFYCDIYGTVMRQFPDGSRDTVLFDPDIRLINILDRLDTRIIRVSASGIVYTDDSGNSWKNAAGAPDMSMLNISDNDVWMARLGTRVFLLVQHGQNDLLLRSGDLGASWQTDTFFAPDGCDKYRLWATSRAVYLNAYCMGQTGFSPSGQWRLGLQDSTWQMFTPPIKDLSMIGETDSALIGIHSWSGSLYRSTDQGTHWDAIPPGHGWVDVYDQRPFFHWPDGRSLVSSHEGWHLKTDDAALYRHLPDVENNCFSQTIQRSDSVFWACSPLSLYEGVCFTPDRGATWDTLVPLQYLGYGKIEKLIWDEDGIFAQIASPANSIRQLGRWSFQQNDWTDLRDFPDGLYDWAKAGGNIIALADAPGGAKPYVSTDGGNSWKIPDQLPPSISFQRIEAGGNAIFAIVGSGAGFYRTDNGGQTWDKLPDVYPAGGGWPLTPKRMLTAPDGMLFMMAEGFGQHHILFSEDDGFNWIELSDPQNLPYLSRELLHIGPDEQVYVANYFTLMRRPTADFRKLVARARVLMDANGNGIVDPGDTPAEGIPVSSASHVALTDSNGMAHVGLRADLMEDSLRLVVNLPNILVSPAFHPVNDPGAVYTFLLTPEKPRYLEVQIQAYQPPRPGFAANYQVQAVNYGVQPESGRLKLVLDPQMQWLDATPAPYASAGDTLYWQVNDLKPWTVFQASIIAELSVAAPLGEQVYLTVAMEVDSSQSGWTIAASDTLWALIVGAYDPNDKQVTPAGNLTPERVAGGLELIYTVRFQNTGTYLAENVLVVDTLPSGLDVRTFRFLASSHPCEMRLKASNILEFYFENIQLPDSNANEPASHGFLRFSIRPFANLTLGTVIRNEADIYFDFNPPIRTNAAVNNIVLSNRELPSVAFLPLQCHPNPAQSEIWIDWPENRDAQARLYRRDGALMGVFPLQAHKRNRLGIGHLPAGLYGVQVVSEGRTYGGRFVKI